MKDVAEAIILSHAIKQCWGRISHPLAALPRGCKRALYRLFVHM